MKINKKRIENDFNEIAQFGSLKNGGVTRLAFTQEDMDARNYLKKVMQDMNLSVSIDAFGNMRGKRKGKEELPPVVIGSHLDTVPEGGHYDGVVGVITALEVIRVLNENKITTKRPIEVINFSAEESSRFGGATLGSKAISGKLTDEDLIKYKDSDGISLYKALETSGFNPDNLASAELSLGDIYSFIEIHIEQGSVLETKDVPIGIVTAIAAPTRFNVVIKGKADHSGTTPMSLRHDALVAASELVLGVEQVAKKQAGEATVATVGYLNVKPGAMNVVPGEVELGIDIRDINSTDKNKAVQSVKKLMEKISLNRSIKIDYVELTNDEPVILDDQVINTLESVAKNLEIPYAKMHSGAGHDTMNMADITRAGMMFIPSEDGISHNIEEFSKMDDICLGAEILLKATLDLAQEDI